MCRLLLFSGVCAVLTPFAAASAADGAPVYDPPGRCIAEFNSIWRQDEDGRWRVIFDKGCHAFPAEGER